MGFFDDIFDVVDDITDSFIDIGDEITDHLFCDDNDLSNDDPWESPSTQTPVPHPPIDKPAPPVSNRKPEPEF